MATYIAFSALNSVINENKRNHEKMMDSYLSDKNMNTYVINHINTEGGDFYQ